MVAECSHTEGTHRRTLIEAVEGTRASHQHLITLLLTPSLYSIVEPVHRNLVDRLDGSVLGVGLVHQLIDRLLQELLLFGRDLLENWSIVTHEVAKVCNHVTGYVTAFDGTLVHILVQSSRSGAIERTPDDVNHRTV